jgi:hypothetical protein
MPEEEYSFEELKKQQEELQNRIDELKSLQSLAESQNLSEDVTGFQAVIDEAQNTLDGITNDLLKKGCNRRDMDMNWMRENIEECKTFINSESYAYFQKAIANKHTIDPCGKNTLGTINVALQTVFQDLKDAKRYYNEYVTPTLNTISGINESVSNATELIAGALKILIQRARNWLLKIIKDKLEAFFEEILPDMAQNIQGITIKQIIDTLFCKINDVINGLSKLVGEFLFSLIGNWINAPFCAAEQFTNALINNIANRIDKALQPILDGLGDILGEESRIAGQIFYYIDLVLGYEAFLCTSGGIKCPSVKTRGALWWGGGEEAAADKYQNFLNGLNLSGGESADLLNRFDRWLGGDSGLGDMELFGTKFGDVDPNIADQFTCYAGDPNCGPPKMQIFGGGGAGAVGDVIVNEIGQIVGVNLRSGGGGYTSPPFVAFIDDCQNGNFASGYVELDNDRDTTLTLDPITFSPIGNSGGINGNQLNNGNFSFDPNFGTFGFNPNTTGSFNENGKCIYEGDVYHVFDNDTDTGIALEVSAGFDVLNGAPNAPDFQPIRLNSTIDMTPDKKHYQVRFNVPYDNADYDIEVTEVTQRAAHGGSGGVFQPFRDENGKVIVKNKTARGFDIWFGRTAVKAVRDSQEAVPVIGSQSQTGVSVVSANRGTLFVKEGGEYYLLTGGLEGGSPYSVRFEFDWKDYQDQAGLAVTGIRIPGLPLGDLVVTRDIDTSAFTQLTQAAASPSQREIRYTPKGSQQVVASVEPRKKYGPIIFENLNRRRDPRIVDAGSSPNQKQQRIIFYDGEGDDTNAKFTALDIIGEDFVVSTTEFFADAIVDTGQPILYQPEIYLKNAPPGTLISSYVRGFTFKTAGDRSNCHPGKPVKDVIIVNPGVGYTSRPENRPEGSIERSFIGCFTDIDILNTGNGYSPEDEITITPNVENLRVSVQMNDLGQIIAMEVLDEVCGLTSLPVIEINSSTGVGFKARTRLSFTPVEEYIQTAEENRKTIGDLDPAQLIQVIDCVL